MWSEVPSFAVATSASPRLTRWAALFIGVVACSCLAALPAVADATSSVSPCDKVSAASVSAIVGYKVPAATFMTIKQPPTALNDHISGVLTLCTYGAETAANLTKVVSLQVETTSKPISLSLAERQIKALEGTSLQMKLVPYSGLGVPGVYFSLSGGGITGEGIEGFSGTKGFGASVFRPISKPKLAALAKLARNI